MKLISVTAIGAFQLATKGGYQRVIRKKYNKAEFRDISQFFLVIGELFFDIAINCFHTQTNKSQSFPIGKYIFFLPEVSLF